MTNLMNKMSSALSNVIMLAAAVAMAGLGFAFMGTLVLIVLIAIGITVIAAPFAAKPQPHADTDVVA